MASLATSAKVYESCTVDFTYQGQIYKDFNRSVLPELCADLILGLDFQSQHESVVFQYGGSKPPLSVCGFSMLNMEPPKPFANLTSDCEKEVTRLLEEGIIEPSLSPWRAQVLVTKDSKTHKRLVIDYSQTINRFTHLDAFPLPISMKW